MRDKSSLCLSAVFIVLAIFAVVGCSGLPADDTHVKEDSSMTTSDYDQTGSEGFVGSLEARMSGQRDDLQIIAPLSIYVEDLDGNAVIGETDIPADGSPLPLGDADGTWLQAHIVRLPVYADMTTYDYREINSTYWIDAEARKTGRGLATVDVDVSAFSQVKLTHEYLASVIEERESYYDNGVTGFEAIRENAASEERAASASRAAERCQRRLEQLEQVMDRLEVSGNGDDELLALYSDMCRADSF